MVWGRAKLAKLSLPRKMSRELAGGQHLFFPLWRQGLMRALGKPGTYQLGQQLRCGYALLAFTARNVNSVCLCLGQRSPALSRLSICPR